MIEIYHEDSAKNVDKTCIGISTKTGKIVGVTYGDITETESCTDTTGVSERQQIYEQLNGGDKNDSKVIPNMRLVTIGEVLKKKHSEEGKDFDEPKQKSNNLYNIITPFSISTSTNNTNNWEAKLDETLKIKIGDYITTAFKCRQIEPTSNNKESSRSHVIVLVMCKSCTAMQGRNVTLMVGDFAGVENELKCEIGSIDMVRMMAKVRDNPDYSNKNSKGILEKWENIGEAEANTSKRRDNLIRYVNKLVMGPNPTSEGKPPCWPDGTMNKEGDIEQVKKTVIYLFIEILCQKVMGRLKNSEGWKGNRYVGQQDRVSKEEKNIWENIPQEIREEFRIILKKFPLTEKSIEETIQNINNFFGIGDSDKGTFFKNGKKRHFRIFRSKPAPKLDFRISILTAFISGFKPFIDNTFNDGKFRGLINILDKIRDANNEEKIKEEIISAGILINDKIRKDRPIRSKLPHPKEPGTQKGDGLRFDYGTYLTEKPGRMADKGREWYQFISTFYNKVKRIFRLLDAPQCKLSYLDGFTKACEVRGNEGKVINGTLAEMAIDLKRISSKSIINKLSENGDKKYPCIFADMYNNFSNYWVMDPLMDWYSFEKDGYEHNYGSVMKAVCILKLLGKSFHSDTDTDDKRTISYVKSIVGELTSEKIDNELKDFQFVMTTIVNATYLYWNHSKGEPRLTPAGEYIYVNNIPIPPYINIDILKKNIKLFDFYKNQDNKKTEHFKNLVGTYLDLLIKLLTHEFYEEYAYEKIFGNDENIRILIGNVLSNEININNDFIDECENLYDYIKRNNDATLVGTIKTTTDINRVSDNVLICEKKNDNAGFNSIEKGNINYKILEKFIDIDKKMKSASDTSRESIKSATLYACLYYINELALDDSNGSYKKICYTMKEREINSIIKSIESVHPIAKHYIDYNKLQNIWETVSSLDRREIFSTFRQIIHLNEIYVKKEKFNIMEIL